MKSEEMRIKSKKQLDQKHQRLAIQAAFMFFALVLEQNKDFNITDNLKRIFTKLSVITKSFEKFLHKDVNAINSIVKQFEAEYIDTENPGNEADVDYILLSVTIIAVYYEKTKGKKRYFYPMGYNDILEIQDEIIEDLEKNNKDYMIDQTFDFADYLVDKIFEIIK